MTGYSEVSWNLLSKLMRLIFVVHHLWTAQLAAPTCVEEEDKTKLFGRCECDAHGPKWTPSDEATAAKTIALALSLPLPLPLPPMATATAYTLRLSPPPPSPSPRRQQHHHAPLLPQRPRSRRGATARAAAAASWAPTDRGSDDGLGGWWLPVPEQQQQQKQPAERGREGGGGSLLSDSIARWGLWADLFSFVSAVGIGIAGSRRALAVGLGASAAIALVGMMWHLPSSRKCELLTGLSPFWLWTPYFGGVAYFTVCLNAKCMGWIEELQLSIPVGRLAMTG